jgi:hypothetical protein
MPTAVFPGANHPIPITSQKTQPSPGLPFPSLSKGEAGSSVGDLTIRRITGTHHGRTLLTLGHAAEYLANSRRYSMRAYDREAEVEAVHILLELSRSVFEEYAERRSLHRRFENWLIERAARPRTG